MDILSNKIWFFGASNTAHWNLKNEWTNNYVKYKGYVPKHFTELLSDRLNLTPNNKGIGAIDNYTIFETIIKNIHEIKSDDKIVVDWVSPIRFRIVENNKFKTIIPNLKYNYNQILCENTLNEILINRDSKLFVEEVIYWTELLIKLYGKNIVFWTDFSQFNSQPYLIKTGNLKNVMRISQETNGIIDDKHYGEEGHIILADCLYKALIKKNKFI
jgi:hypothetical protein